MWERDMAATMNAVALATGAKVRVMG